MLLLIQLAAHIALGDVLGLSRPSAPACSVAADVISDQIRRGKPAAMIVAPSRENTAKDRARDLGAGWRTDPPSRELLHSWASAGFRDILACSDVRERTRRAGVRTGETEVKRAVGDAQTEMLSPGRYEILYVGTPVVSRNEREALVEISVVCGGLCGAGSLLHLRKDSAGIWRTTDARNLWIS